MRYLIPLCIFLLAFAGCDDSDDDENDAQPDAGVVQQSAMMDGAVQEAAKAANAAITEAGQGTATINATACRATSGGSPLACLVSPSMLQAPTTATTTIYDFAASIDLTGADAIDLADYSDTATGTVGVLAEAVAGIGSMGENGSITYEVTVTFDTAVTAEDPNRDLLVTWDAGTSFTYTLDLTWLTNQDGSSEVTVAYQLVVNNHDVLLTSNGYELPGTVDGMTINASAVLAVDVDGNVSIPSITLTGYRNVTWTTADGVEHTVYWDIQSPARIFITVDGEVYGPYTVLEVAAFFSAQAQA